MKSLKKIVTFRSTIAGLFALVLLELMLPSTALARAAIIVGAGTPQSCTEWALQDALVAAGLEGADVIKFNCGASPTTIVITTTTTLPDGTVVALAPPHQTTIDGGGTVTISPSEWSGNLIVVGSGTTVVIRNLTIQGSSYIRPFSNDSDPHIVNRGTLLLRDVTMLGGGGGAALDNRGTLSIQNSTFSGSYFASAAIQNHGNATVDQSELSNYSSRSESNDGGAILNMGLLTVRNSVFTNNVLVLGDGAAIASLGGTVIINNCEFSHNVAYAGAVAGRFGSGSISVVNSTFSDNQAFQGGGIDAYGSSVIVKNSKFLRNSATFGGAIEANVLYVEKSTISTNSATWGGGVYGWNDGAMTIVNSQITSNIASGGGGIYLSEFGVNGSLTLLRSDVSGNTPDDIWQP